MSSLRERIVGSLYADPQVFDEVEHDQSATSQAAGVVIVAALLAALGEGVAAEGFIIRFIVIALWAVVAWFLWAALTLLIGTRVFEGQANMGEMLRVIGFANAPRAANVLVFIPIIGWAIRVIVSLWSLVVAYVAIREGLDLDGFRALVTVIVGWLVMAIGFAVVVALF